jgi:hypothetical protein
MKRSIIFVVVVIKEEKEKLSFGLFFAPMQKSPPTFRMIGERWLFPSITVIADLSMRVRLSNDYSHARWMIGSLASLSPSCA